MENKFKSDVELEWEYKNFMEEYEKLGYMSPNKELDGRISYFLPHYAVRRKDSITTKLRVVFDGSCKPPKSNSLNSVLGVGQILQLIHNIFTLLVRFRVNEIAFTADIKQMYRQILIDPDDQNLQKIVRRKSLDSNIKEYKLSTVTYGTASASFLATRCLHQISLDCEPQNPKLSSIIQNSFYVDDLMSGASSNKEAIILIKALIQALDVCSRIPPQKVAF
ncbi:DUF1758 domain-containing protein [Trichonephila clavipes]|nr:DUF1758 domain-containing protein [Trichonephila clavipes]